MEQGIVRGKTLMSCYSPVTIPEGGLYQFIHGKLLEFGPNTALIDSTTGAQLTYHEVLKLVERASYHLQQQGVKEGDVFALCAPNSITYAIILLAVTRIGAVFAAMNSLSTADDLKHTLSLAEAKFLFTTQSLASDISRVVATTAIKVIFVDGSKSATSLLEPIPAGQRAPPVRAMPSEDVCGILFSSGTTGLPKAVEMAHASLLGFAAQTSAIGIEYRKSIIFTPLAHVIGIASMIATLNNGSFIVIMPRFDPERFFHLLSKYKTQKMVLVPPILVLLAKSPLVNKYDLTSLEEIVAGAAPISAELEQEVMSRLGGHLRCIRQAYSLTEAGAMSTIMPTRSRQTHPPPPGTVGTLAPNVQLRITDITSGEILGANQTGEIRLKSDFAMIGYKGNPQATREVFDNEGWLRTGDIGYYDDNEYVFVVDRVKELIKYNAYQVPPAELEGLLLTHPGVADVGVIGIPDKLAGELPHAWVVCKPGSSVTEEGIINFVAEKVAPYKKLRGGVKFVTVIPKSPTGKILHRIMRDEMKKMKSNL